MKVCRVLLALIFVGLTACHDLDVTAASPAGSLPPPAAPWTMVLWQIGRSGGIYGAEPSTATTCSGIGRGASGACMHDSARALSPVTSIVTFPVSRLPMLESRRPLCV